MSDKTTQNAEQTIDWTKPIEVYDGGNLFKEANRVNYVGRSKFKSLFPHAVEWPDSGRYDNQTGNYFNDQGNGQVTHYSVRNVPSPSVEQREKPAQPVEPARVDPLAPSVQSEKAVEAERPKLWREGQRFKRSKLDPDDETAFYFVGPIWHGVRYDNDEPGNDILATMSIREFEAAIVSGELIPVDSPPSAAPLEREGEIPNGDDAIPVNAPWVNDAQGVILDMADGSPFFVDKSAERECDDMVNFGLIQKKPSAFRVPSGDYTLLKVVHGFTFTDKGRAAMERWRQSRFQPSEEVR